MSIDEKQKQVILDLWNSFVSANRMYFNAGEETSSNNVDDERYKIMPTIQEILDQFLNGTLALEEFKTQIDSINKRHPLWGFKGINGQMFFNMLTKTAIEFNKKQELDQALKKSTQSPKNIEESLEIIRQFQEFTNDLGNLHSDRRSAPRSGSIPYFLSYFWQIQNPNLWPVYYSSSVNSLNELGIWSPTRDIVHDYEEYYSICYDLVDLVNDHSTENVSLWDIEHLFWFYMQIADEEVVESNELPIVTNPVKITGIPESYIPPVVSIIPKLANHDEEIEALAAFENKSVVTLLEERLSILFRMLGFKTTQLGQGSGRNPDGIAYCREYNYVIIFDAKVRQDGYSMGIDERAIREYIDANVEGLKRSGYRNIYFMIISSNFRGDHDEVIRNLKIETDVSEIILMEAAALLALLDGKLRDPEFSLGKTGLQTLLASSGVITEDYIRREFLN